MKVRVRYYASVTGKITVFLEVMGNNSVPFISFNKVYICLHYNPTGMLYEEDKTLITKSEEELFENGWVTGET